MTEQGQPPSWEPGAAGGPTIPAPEGLNPPSTAAGVTAEASAPTIGADALTGESPAPGRLPRVEAFDLLGRLKATVVVGSVVAFGVFLALDAAHATGVTARAATPNGANSQTTTPTQPSDHGGFFNGGFGVGAPGSNGPASGSAVS